ncbi:MAG: BadF/BadG/BcrA/BcrD ATPase family protein [Bacteroidota bacterium]|nr:BadF/BadG/BcrA/BcrD ATPase family protein [Bacteroidota bacterium]
MIDATTMYSIGLDVGSTTVKAVVVENRTGEILWRDYQRHETRQQEKVLEFLRAIHVEFSYSPKHFAVYVTGSGGNSIVPFIGAQFVQEVNAVTVAVEKLWPTAGSVIELGGQDAKIIIFKEDPITRRKKKIFSMNDKCAGGTGAVIDKINAKLRLPPGALSEARYNGVKIHPVAGKCGVFAETDINGLQKQGVPADELIASLFESIVLQNLSVLTRGHTLRPDVLLLGGPNTFIRGMVECWRWNIKNLWEEREFPLPEGRCPEDCIIVPESGQYYAAIGAVEFGRENHEIPVPYRGINELERILSTGNHRDKLRKALPPLVRDEKELEAFREEFSVKPFMPRKLTPGSVFQAFLGIDGGSTSTKGVLLDTEGRVAFKAYQLSYGNPIEDTKDIIKKLHRQVLEQGADLDILAVGTTGYAKDILKNSIGADIALVETVAHTQAALHFYKNVDVICDVGGQDIKLIILKDNRVVDFKLNTQCSAGNGYFLQSTAESFGFSVDEYADIAFQAKVAPEFGYGCAVFLQSDIVDFQRKGWSPQEILAGLAIVLPKNIWLYVSQIPNLTKLGKTFVLQGGTQHNLAAVKAQVDFIRSRFRSKNMEPRIIVHEHTGEAGAIGCAVEASRLYSEGRSTTFIGLDAVARIRFRTLRNEETRCNFCKNKCMRTFIDVQTNEQFTEKSNIFPYKSGPELLRSARFESEEERLRHRHSKIPLEPGASRLIIASCEKGTVEDIDDMRMIAKNISDVKKQFPSTLETQAQLAWSPAKANTDSNNSKGLFSRMFRVGNGGVSHLRSSIRIAVPRVLNLYSTMPFFTAYFESLGVPFQNFVFSDFTSEELYKEGVKRGSIDPCFPSKVALAHVHNLLTKKLRLTHFEWLFFPIIDDFPTDLFHVVGSKACPTATGTPESVKAAYIKEEDLFRKAGVEYINPFIRLNDPALAAEQLYTAFGRRLKLRRDENLRAVEEGYAALRRFQETLRAQGRQILEELEHNRRIGVVVLGRPYHADPGVNHGIPNEFRKLGYPVLSQDSLPTDHDILEKLFGPDIRAGRISHPMDISDVWKNSYSENTSRKVWAAKFVARHPNLVALELSSFRCGHDAPIYSLVQEIIECSHTPYFSFKDIDENKPVGSIKIRVETIGYFLARYQQIFLERERTREEFERRMHEYAERLKHSLEGTDRFHLPIGMHDHIALMHEKHQAPTPERLETG